MTQNPEIFKLYTDGSSKNNDHLLGNWEYVGIGGYIENSQGEEIANFHDSFEYKHQGLEKAKFEVLALAQGLKLALAHNITHLKCFGDDRALCEILQKYREKENTQKYAEKNNELPTLYSLIDQFDFIDFEYIPRKYNAKADKLSKFKSLVSEQNEQKLRRQSPLKEQAQYQNLDVSTRKRLLLSDYFLENNEKDIENQKIQEILVFHAFEQEKSRWLEVYTVRKKENVLKQASEPEYSYSLYKKINLNHRLTNQAIMYLNSYLRQTKINQLSIMAIGHDLSGFRALFETKILSSPNLIVLLEKTQKLIDKKQYVSYQVVPEIEKEIKALTPISILPDSSYCPKIKTQEVLEKEKKELRQIIELFNQNYVPGTCPDVESRYYRKKEDNTKILNIETLKSRSFSHWVSWHLENQKFLRDIASLTKKEIVQMLDYEVKNMKMPQTNMQKNKNMIF